MCVWGDSFDYFSIGSEPTGLSMEPESYTKGGVRVGEKNGGGECVSMRSLERGYTDILFSGPEYKDSSAIRSVSWSEPLPQFCSLLGAHDSVGCSLVPQRCSSVSCNYSLPYGKRPCPCEAE